MPIKAAFPCTTILNAAPLPATPERGCKKSAALIFLIIAAMTKQTTTRTKRSPVPAQTSDSEGQAAETALISTAEPFCSSFRVREHWHYEAEGI